MKRQKDIVLLVLDTQRVDRLSCYGYNIETSPHLDALAADATRFTQAISTAQWTPPAHASLFTGLYPSQHAMTELTSTLPSTLPTLAERMQQAGYFTASFSNNPFIGEMQNGLQRGFDKVVNYHYIGFRLWTTHLTRADCTSSENQRSALSRYKDTLVNRTLLAIWPLLERALKFKGGAKDYNTQRSLAAAADLLINRRQVEPDQPIFVFINLMGTHVPYAPPRWAFERFVSPIVSKQSMYKLLQRVNTVGLDVNNWVRTDSLQLEHKSAMDGLYNAETAAQDAQLGQFFENLRKKDALDQTFLMVLADHGEYLGERRRINHLYGAYQELAHVPLIIRDPLQRLSRGKAVDNFVSIRRLFHTALAVAGVASPDEANLSLAHSDLDIKTDLPEHNMAFVEAIPPMWAVRYLKDQPELLQKTGYTEPVRAIYREAHKLIATGEQKIELYKIRSDTREQNDLHEVMTKKASDMKSMLLDFSSKSHCIQTKSSQREEDPAVMRRLRDLGYLE